jgi:hypothetical protein
MEALGEEVNLTGDYFRPPMPGRHETACQMFRIIQSLILDGKLRTHPTKLVGYGLEAVLQAIEQLKSGSVSGEKLVVLLE